MGCAASTPGAPKDKKQAVLQRAKAGPEMESGLIDFSNLPIGQLNLSNLQKFCEELKGHKSTIKRLVLRQCKMDDDAMKKCLPAFQELKQLEQLIISENNLGDKSCKELSTAIRGSKTSVLRRYWPHLTRVDFEGNPRMSEVYKKMIIQAIAAHKEHAHKLAPEQAQLSQALAEDAPSLGFAPAVSSSSSSSSSAAPVSSIPAAAQKVLAGVAGAHLAGAEKRASFSQGQVGDVLHRVAVVGASASAPPGDVYIDEEAVSGLLSAAAAAEHGHAGGGHDDAAADMLAKLAGTSSSSSSSSAHEHEGLGGSFDPAAGGLGLSDYWGSDSMTASKGADAQSSDSTAAGSGGSIGVEVAAPPMAKAPKGWTSYRLFFTPRNTAKSLTALTCMPAAPPLPPP